MCTFHKYIELSQLLVNIATAFIQDSVLTFIIFQQYPRHFCLNKQLLKPCALMVSSVEALSTTM
jgi:hypothetical protein